ncbi:hypothetical protein [Poriferisphaera sp. WC338]|uniref:hypothetical protein n=1 Tax=Poriferisphaera sp. WC338 TaxID=3425129 RepID=UPI003D81B6E7
MSDDHIAEAYEKEAFGGKPFHQMVILHLDGLATEAESRAIEKLIANKESYRSEYVLICQQAGLLSAMLRPQKYTLPAALDFLDNRGIDSDGGLYELVDEPTESQDSMSYFEKLQSQESDSIQTYKVIVIPKVIAYGSAAAVITMLLMVVYSILPSGGSSDRGAITATKTQIDTFEQVVERGPVAKLIGISDGAVWADSVDSMRSGQGLSKGTLQLEQGEIAVEFNSGTVATIKGPAAFSLVNDNASEMIAGIASFDVPTSGHGFEVLIPGGVVTDFGTAFEIDVNDHHEASRVEVTDGMVTVQNREGENRSEPVQLRRNQFADILRTGKGLAAFMRVRERVELPIRSTGYRMTDGKVDPDWHIYNAATDKELPAFIISPRRLDPEGNNLVWLASDSHSQWLSPIRYAASTGKGQYIFKTNLYVPESFDASTIILTLKFIVDERLESIHVNGQEIAGSFKVPNEDQMGLNTKIRYQTWTTHTIQDVFSQGNNTLEFIVSNDNGAIGFRAELTAVGDRLYRPILAPN